MKDREKEGRERERERKTDRQRAETERQRGIELNGRHIWNLLSHCIISIR